MVAEIKNTVLRAIQPGAVIVVLDTETTGLSPEDCNIIQFAGIKMTVDEDFKFSETEKLDLYIKQTQPLPAKIVEITGITDEMLSEGMSETEAEAAIWDFVEDANCIVAHNARFDDGFMCALLERYGHCYNAVIIDTLAMAKDLVRKDETASYKLIDLAKHFKIKNEVFHSADADTFVCKEIFIQMFNQYKADAETPVELVRPKIWKIKYWDGFRGLSRVYIFTNYGTYYYDNKYKLWDVKKDDKKINIKVVDMDYLRNKVLTSTHCVDEAELSKWKGEVFVK